MVRDPLAKRFTKVDVRYVRACGTRVHVRIPFPYLGNCSTDCTEIWCVARGVAMCVTQGGRICTNASVTVTHLSTSIRSRSFIAQKASYWFITCNGCDHDNSIFLGRSYKEPRIRSCQPLPCHALMSQDRRALGILGISSLSYSYIGELPR